MSERNSRFSVVKKDGRLILRALRLVRSFAPGLMFCTLFSSLLSVVQTYLNIYLPAMILDEFSGERRLNTLIVLVSVFLGAELVLHTAQKFLNVKSSVFGKLCQLKEEMYLNQKSFSLDYPAMEDPAIRMERQTISENRGGGGLNTVVEYVNALFSSVLSIFTAVALLCEIFSCHAQTALSGFLRFADSDWALLCLGALVLVAMIHIGRITAVNGMDVYRSSLEMPQIYKVSHYYSNEYLDDASALKDVHIFGQQQTILDSFSRAFSRWTQTCIHMQNKNGKIILESSVTNALFRALTYLFVAVKTYVGAFGIGSFYKYSACISNLIQSSGQIVATIVNLHIVTTYFQLFFDYLDLPAAQQQPGAPIPDSENGAYEIEFHHVFFRYPHSDTDVLEDVCLKVRSGETLAVVGVNGSGKTTLIKLMCGLYKPTKGYISLNGTDIQALDRGEYMKLFSVVFQDFKLFSFSLGFNVAASTDYDPKKAEQCLTDAGMGERLRDFYNGLDTPIYKDFDVNGIEISGGEAQKIAIARAIYKDGPIVVLDEPTAALDPIAEAEVYEHFNGIIKGKTAVFISHRLSSCRFCDRIVVFRRGHILQTGTHTELLSDGSGEYFRLWQAQAQYYQQEAFAQEHRQLL